MTANAAQHTPDWYRSRLGNITGSMVGKLMENSRSKGDIFSVKGKAELYRIAAERTMNPEILEDDTLFEYYLQQTCVNSKPMQFGTDQEPFAREKYMQQTGRRIVEVGSIRHPSIPYFASSPDGFYYNEENGEKGTIEIKCPSQSTFMEYESTIHDNGTLMKVEPKYFYQCMAHMMVTGSSWCDFIAYCPWQRHPIHIARIYADDAVFRKVEDRVMEANKIIDTIISNNTL